MNPVGNYPWHFHGALDGQTWEATWLWRRADSHQDVEKIFSWCWFMHSMKGNVVWTCLIHLWSGKLSWTKAAHKEYFTPQGAKIRISSV